MFDGIRIKKEAVLAPYTTLHVGGPAEYLAFPNNQQELQMLLKEAKKQHMPVYFLGGGSNLLVGDAGVRGLVIQLAGDFKQIQVSNNHIRVGAAYSFPKLTRLCLELGWESALGWSGVPGSVGGALKMNAGTRLGEIGEVVQSVEAMNSDGPIKLNHEQIGFQYRQTHFPQETILCYANLFYRQANPEKKEILLLRVQELTKTRKASQPKQRSAGSIFKNPPGDYAGRLIEACGLKGFAVGGAHVSEVHANFIVNKNNSKAKDIIDIAEFIKKKVYNNFSIQLEYEVRRWGF